MIEYKEFDCPADGVGYKVFERYKGEKLQSPYCPAPKSMSLNTEYKADYLGPIKYWRQHEKYEYVGGFHIFTTMEGAINYISDPETECVYEVSYRNLGGKGIQDNHDCITAEFMTINKEVHRDPILYHESVYEDVEDDYFDIEDFDAVDFIEDDEIEDYE